MTKQSKDFQNIIEEIKSNNPQEEWSGLIKDAKDVSVAVKEVLTPCNIESTEDDQQHAKSILANDKNYVIRYLRQYPTVGLATIPVRNKDGEIIADMDWVRKRVICTGVPYACMIAFMHQDNLLIGWSKRIETRKLVETGDFLALFKIAINCEVSTADSIDSVFAKFTDELLNLLTYQKPKDIEVSFSKNSGKTAAIIRGLHDDIIIHGNNFVESAASGPVPHDIAKNLRWFIDYAEKTYSGKAGNVRYPEFATAVPVKAEDIHTG